MNLRNSYIKNIISETVKKPKYDINDCRIISLYADNDGSQCLTNAINLIKSFSDKGNRILVIDCDSERSLSYALLKTKVDLAVEAINKADLHDQNEYEIHLTTLNNREIKDNHHRTLYDQVVDDDLLIKPVDAFNINQNTWLVPGHKDMNKLENIIIKDEMSNTLLFNLYNLDGSNDKTGKAYASIMKNAETYEIDYVFLYLGRGAVLNKCLIFSSHYFIILVNTSLKGLDHVHSVIYNLKKWTIETRNVRQKMIKSNFPVNFPSPQLKPKFLGLILNVSLRFYDSVRFDKFLIMAANRTDSLLSIRSEHFLISNIISGVKRLRKFS